MDFYERDWPAGIIVLMYFHTSLALDSRLHFGTFRASAQMFNFFRNTRLERKCLAWPACGGLTGGSAAAAQPGAARLARCWNVGILDLDCCWKKEDKRRWECRYSNNKRRPLCTLSKELHLRSSSALNSAWSWRKPRRCGCDIAVCAATPTGFSRATGGPITTCWLSTLAFGALFTLRYDI